ncbi:MAG: GntR family transcriptional regulator [Herbinix sp.]|jgi:DNA-binding FadR family transcriptional regulator|nr:GntR family transcriptional regulator [Herbinix sp.]
MKFNEIISPSLKELFIQEIENSILSGKLEIGEQLPSERELAGSMKVSRAVVNAGIKEMALKGFLEIKPRSGTYVADYRRSGTIDTLLSIMKYNGGQLKREDVRSILELKVVLDTLGAELFLTKNKESDLKSLENRLINLRESQTKELIIDNYFEFYQELMLLSGNTLLPLIYYSFRKPVLSLLDRYSRKHGTEPLIQTAQHLFDALKRQDLDNAKRCIKERIGEAITGSKEIYNE